MNASVSNRLGRRLLLAGVVSVLAGGQGAALDAIQEAPYLSDHFGGIAMGSASGVDPDALGGNLLLYTHEDADEISAAVSQAGEAAADESDPSLLIGLLLLAGAILLLYSMAKREGASG